MSLTTTFLVMLLLGTPNAEGKLFIHQNVVHVDSINYFDAVSAMCNELENLQKEAKGFKDDVTELWEKLDKKDKELKKAYRERKELRIKYAAAEKLTKVQQVEIAELEAEVERLKVENQELKEHLTRAEARADSLWKAVMNLVSKVGNMQKTIEEQQKAISDLMLANQQKDSIIAQRDSVIKALVICGMDITDKRKKVFILDGIAIPFNNVVQIDGFAAGKDNVPTYSDEVNEKIRRLVYQINKHNLLVTLIGSCNFGNSNKTYEKNIAYQRGQSVAALLISKYGLKKELVQAVENTNQCQVCNSVLIKVSKG